MPTHKTVRTVAAFITEIGRTCRSDEVVFRGQPAKKPLMPRIGRSSFRPRRAIETDEKEMLEHFRSRSLPYLTVTPHNNWEWLALAQHHGMATRLLDWTQNPLAALWFAAHAPTQRKCDGEVWYFSVRAGDRHATGNRDCPFDITRTWVVRPRHIAPRITRQAGWFTVHHTAGRRPAFVPLEANQQFKARLHRLVIPHECFSQIRSTLDRCGIHRASLMPDLSGLAMHIEWLHSRLPDETKPSAKNCQSALKTSQ